MEMWRKPCCFVHREWLGKFIFIHVWKTLLPKVKTCREPGLINPVSMIWPTAPPQQHISQSGARAASSWYTLLFLSALTSVSVGGQRSWSGEERDVECWWNVRIPLVLLSPRPLCGAGLHLCLLPGSKYRCDLPPAQNGSSVGTRHSRTILWCTPLFCWAHR